MMEAVRQPSVGSFARPNSLPPLPRPSQAHEVAAACNFQPGDLCSRRPGVPIRRSKLTCGGGGRNWTQSGRRNGSNRPAAELFRCPDAASPRHRGRSLVGLERLSQHSSSRSQTPRVYVDVETNAASIATPRRHQQSVTSGPLRAVKAAYLGAEGYPPVSKAEEFEPDVEIQATSNLEERVEARIRRELAEMRTGEDAVAFFTRNGNNTDVKVLYCINTASANNGHGFGESVGPYDLTVVPEAKISSQIEYFTISAVGVVHFQPGQLSDCLALSEWVHQCMMYRVLTSMSFFRLYAHRKAFFQWNTGARYAAYSRRRQRLARRCFLTRPMLAGPLMQTKALVSSVENVKLLQIPDQCCHLVDFMHMQQKCLTDRFHGAQSEIEKKRDEIVAVMEAMTTAVGSAAASAASVPTSKKGAAFSASRSKSVAQEKQESKDRIRRQQLLQEDLASLGFCLRLAEFMFQATLSACALKAAKDLEQRVDGGPVGQTQKLFYASVSLGAKEGEVILDPCPEKIQEVFSSLWEEIICTLDAAPPVSSERKFMPYRSSTSEEARFHRVRDILISNRTWTGCIRSVEASLDAQLAEAQRFAIDMYEPYRRIQDFGQDWNQEAFAAKTHSVQSLCRHIKLLLDFKEDLLQFRGHRTVGVVVVDGRDLRECLTPVPEISLAPLCQRLVVTARGSCSSLLLQLEKLIKEVDERPEQGYALQMYMQLIEAAEKQERSLQAQVDEIHEAQLLLRKCNSRIPLEDQVLHEETAAKQREFCQESLPAAKGFLAKRLREKQSSPVAEAEVVVTVEVPDIPMTDFA